MCRTFRYGFFKTTDSRASEVTGTVSRDGYGFRLHAWSVLGLNRGRGLYFDFLGAPMIL